MSTVSILICAWLLNKKFFNLGQNMKLYHIIGLSTASLLSLGALGSMAQTEATPYNTDFRLETLSGKCYGD